MEFLLKFPPPPEAPSSSSSPADEDGDESPDLQATHHLIVSMFKCITKLEDLCLSVSPSLSHVTHSAPSGSLAGIFMYKLFPVFRRPSKWFTGRAPPLAPELDSAKVSSSSTSMETAPSSPFSTFLSLLPSILSICNPLITKWSFQVAFLYHATLPFGLPSSSTVSLVHFTIALLLSSIHEGWPRGSTQLGDGYARGRERSELDKRPTWTERLAAAGQPVNQASSLWLNNTAHDNILTRWIGISKDRETILLFGGIKTHTIQQWTEEELERTE